MRGEPMYWDETYESEPTFLRVLINILRQTSTRHPNGNELEGIMDGTDEGDNVRVF